MSIATHVRKFYIAGDPGIDSADDTPRDYDPQTAFEARTSEDWFVEEGTGLFVSTGESLGAYKQRLKEGRVWQPS